MRAQEITLSNGLRVIYLHHKSCININMQLEISVGAMHDPLNKSGLAHALEHCVLMQTKNLRGNSLQIELKKIGGNVNAFTGETKTCFPLKARAENNIFLTLADLLRQIITEPFFDDERIKKELSVINNEYHDELDDEERLETIKTINLQRSKAVFLGKVLGDPKQFMTLTANDFYGFMREHYKANSMRLYVVAPYELNKICDILEGTFGQIPEGGREFKLPVDIYGKENDTRVLNGKKSQNLYKLFFTIPSFIDSKPLNITTIARDVIAKTLIWSLRYEAGCTYSPNFYSMDMTSAQQVFTLNISTRPHQTGDFMNAFVKYVTNIDNMPDDEIQSEIDNLKYQLLSSKQLPDFECGGISFFDQILDRPLDLEQDMDSLESITTYDVREKMKEILSSLSGIYINGPQLDLFPPLAQVKEELKKAAGLEEKNPTPQTNVLGQPRI